MPVPEETMAIIRCIECYSELRQEDDVLVCTGCGLRFPVEDDIPIMLAEAAFREEDSS